MFLRRRRQGDIPQDNPDRWLLTYADMITLLLAFFVVMYSMSVMDAKKFGKVSQALRGILKGGPSILKNEHFDQIKEGQGLLKIGSLQMLQSSIYQKAEQMGKESEIVTEMNERGLTIHIMESALFDEGRAYLKPRAMEVLDMVAGDIRAMPNHVRVEGHTDDRSINNEKFPSNWELSTARATNVVRYFIDNHSFPPDKISALGYASYRPYVPNNSIENRAKNRRVDVVVLTVELSAAEPASGINEFATQQINTLREAIQEIDSASIWNNLPPITF